MRAASPHHIHIKKPVRSIDIGSDQPENWEACKKTINYKVVASTVVGRAAVKYKGRASPPSNSIQFNSIQLTNGRQRWAPLPHTHLVRWFYCRSLIGVPEPGNDSAGIQPTHFYERKIIEKLKRKKYLLLKFINMCIINI